MIDRKTGNYSFLTLVTMLLFSAGIIERIFWYAHSDVWLLGLIGRISIAEANAYLEMSHNLLAAETNHYRMPLYPMILASIRQVFGPEVWKIVLFNHAVSVASLYVLYKLVGHCLERKWALFAASIYSVDPVSVFFANGVHAETVFSFLVLISIYWFLLAVSRNAIGWLIVSFLGFGLCILTRPNAWYFVYLIPCLTAWFFSAGWVRRLKMAIVSFIIIAGVALPWFFVHLIVHDQFRLSSAQGLNLLQVEAANAKAYAEKRTTASVNEEFEKEWNFSAIADPFQRAAAQQDLAIEVLSQYPKSYLIVRLKSTIKLFLNTGERRTCTKYYLRGMHPTEGFLVLNELPFLQRIKEKVNYRVQHMTGCEWVVGGTVSGYSLFLYLGVVIGAFTVWKKKKRIQLLFWLSMAMVVYFSVFTHSVPETKFRLPMAPFLVVLGILGYFGLIENMRCRRQEQRGRPTLSHS